jgi:xanthine dehydrogenase accessory factor
VGSQLAVNDQLAFVGSVSGGCVEASVVEEAQAVIASGSPRTLEFGVTDAMAWEVGLACGGRIEVRLEALVSGDPTFSQLLTARRALESVVLAVDLATADRLLVRVAREETPSGIEAWLWEAARDAARRDRSCVVDGPHGAVFLHVFNPPLRLIVVGAVHIAQALVPMAQLAGFDVTVVDPRQGFATAERFPDVDLVVEWPDEALEALALDRRAAVAVLSHDPKLDDPALVAALRSNAVYIGALGSKKTQAARKERLRALGFGDDDLARVNGPIGLPIGASTPAEIAVSTLAQVVEVVRLGER